MKHMGNEHGMPCSNVRLNSGEIMRTQLRKSGVGGDAAIKKVRGHDDQFPRNRSSITG